MKYMQIQWTASSLEEAKTIAEELVRNELVACANILPGIESIFSWEGKVQHAQEVKVFFKTSPENFDEICVMIKEKASYEVPEISGITMDACSADFLKWVYAVTK